MQKLLNEFGYLCRMAARRYAWLTERDAAIDADDLRQIAFVGLCKAATTYREERSNGKTFAAWAWLYVCNEIKRAVRPVKVESLDAPIADDDDSHLTPLMETLPDESCPESDAFLLTDEIVQAVRAAVDGLPDDQREVVRLHGLEGNTLQQCDELRDTEPGTSKRLNGRAVRTLAKDVRLQNLVRDLDAETNFLRYKSVNSFFTTRSSAVEDVVLWRLERGAKTDGKEMGQNAEL